MHRVLLVDDEPLILSGIKFMVDWEKNGCELVGTARNGRQALEAIGSLRPHIVIADINMPVMTGIELLAAAQESHPEVVFIMLTNLEEFDLVRESLRMRAVDYLTKTQLEPETLEAALAAAKKEADERSSLARVDLARETAHIDGREVLRGAVKRMLFQGALSANSMDALRQSGVLEGYGVIQMWLLPAEEAAPAEQHRRSRWASEVVEKLAENCFGQFVTFGSDWKCLLLVYWGGGMDHAADRVAVFAEKLAGVSQDILGMRPCVLATDLLRGDGDAGRCRAQLAALGESFYLTGKTPLYYGDLQAVEYRPLGLQGVAGRLRAELNSHNGAGCDAILDRVIQQARETPHEKAQMLWLCGELYDTACKAFAATEGGHYFADSAVGFGEIERLETREQVVAWLQMLRNEIGAQLESPAPGRSELLEKVKQYVRDNVGKRILLQDAADHACISPAYLSAMFKKESNQSFIDYVNQTKMERACELIREERHRMNEIGYMLGFENAYYFSRVFRRHKGMSPTEYQHSIKSGSKDPIGNGE